MNNEFSEEEFFVLVVTGILTIVATAWWHANVWRVATLGAGKKQRVFLYFVPVACAAMLFPVLWFLTAREVQENRAYVLLFMTTGVTWLAAALWAMRLLGLSLRDDAVENRNSAAVAAISGAMLGVTLAYAGGNIGEGPSIWNTMFAALLSTSGLFVLWLVLEFGARVSDAITIDRDFASGVRLAGFLVSAGLILGRSVAGDWVSVPSTVSYFLRSALPTLLLTVVAILVQRKLRPTPHNPVPDIWTRGSLPAAIYFVAAIACVVSMGSWKQSPTGAH